MRSDHRNVSQTIGQQRGKYHLARLRTFPNVNDQFLLLLLEFPPLAIQLSLRLRKRPLVLSKSLGWGHGPAKQCFLSVISGPTSRRADVCCAHDDVHGGTLTLCAAERVRNGFCKWCWCTPSRTSGECATQRSAQRNDNTREARVDLFP